MISERDKKKIIDYPAERLTFNVTSYEWIDNLCFTISPEECMIMQMNTLLLRKPYF